MRWLRSPDKVFDVGALLLLGFTLLAVAAPLLCVLVLSFRPVDASSSMPSLLWYAAIGREIDPNIWINTLALAVPVATVGTCAGFVGALNWWSPGRLYAVLALGFGVAALPSATHATAISYCFRLLGVTRSSIPILIITDAAWVLPFCAVIIIAGMGHIRESQVWAGLELTGGRRRVVIATVILRPLIPSVVSAFLVALLLSSNEYVRSAYMSGPVQLLSKYVYGKMQSGADPTVYALTGTNIVVAFGVVCSVLIGLKLSRRAARV